MNVIVEGPDNTGKSTLIKSIREQMPQLTFIPGGGPEKYPGEINDRVNKLLYLENSLFDRHPCVSQMIYGRFRSPASPVEYRLLDEFYATKPIFIYCFGAVTLDGHEVKGEHDTPEHLAMVAQNNQEIHRLYSEWAERYATIQFCYQMVHWGLDDNGAPLLPPPNFHSTHNGVIKALKEAMQ